ncbi:MAG: hypothetical protein ABL879_19015, partial [Devosia sp.]
MAVLRRQHALKNGFVGTVDVLIRPHRLDQMVIVMGIVAIELADPAPEFAGDGVRFASAQFEARLVASPILRAPEKIHQSRNGRTGDLRARHERPALGRDPPNPPAVIIAPGIAEIVLRVIDDRIIPIGDVDRTVGTDLDVNGPEIRVLRFDERLEDVGA